MNTAVQPARLFDFQRYGQWMLTCPCCGCGYTHIQKTYALEGSDPFEGGSEDGELFNVPVGGLSEYRRGALVVEFWAECGHSFEVELQQHRGETFLTPRMLEVRK